ncbi:ABC transporter substrate-binding protein [Pseudaminobacter soli (ex Li et al. 2025)]|uniref:ABC transporter substrate-binding protein n=1 Tax=Pseudaminobacter soli (ex Li et al. 2025) TaxID=1295366 RepID=UPI0024763A39|nr:ABC transporter substrate-binding protein [Mesorhizobium soli]
MLLAACQSNGNVSDMLDPGGSPSQTKDGPAPQAALVLGEGPAKVTMLLPLSAPGQSGERGRKMKDAAQLAMNDLGNKILTLTIEDTRGDDGRAKELALKALSSRVVIGPTELSVARHLAQVSGKLPPVLTLAENFDGAPGIYSVPLNEADSAAAGAAAIAAKGARKFVLLVPRGPDASVLEKRVANSLSVYGASLAVTIPYDAGEGSATVVTNMKALVEAPEAIILATGNDNPVFIAGALKSEGFLKKGMALVGTHRWLEHPMDDQALQGAYIAALDAKETGPIAERFKAKFNYPADITVAYAYDTVALTAGIANALGPDGLQKSAFETPAGFRGSTGVFRFRSDGGSERSMPFYRIENSKLKQIAKSTSG